jgi:2-succinyl-5-enolpyruvyl-6-hydroxy-3-cyclohexene-1-carboxylate synthase
MTSPRTESPASEFAGALLAEFVRLGVRDVVVAPGSRSQALVLAATQFERAGLMRLRVRIDERSAGFLALGIALETATPVLVVTTSGTAVANLHPAVLEASHSGVPLIVLTGDRPAELRGIGANQTTRQEGIFGTAVRRSWDVPAPVGGDAAAAVELARAALDDIDGPVHLNLAFRDPLSAPVALPEVEPGVWVPSASAGQADVLHPAAGTVVVAGRGAGAPAEAAARALGAPLLAEVVSGARFGPNLVPAYRELISAANFGDRVERVVVFGHPTLSREVPALIERPAVETIVVRGPGREDYNPGRRARMVDGIEVPDDPAALAVARSWVGRWVVASREILQVEDTPAAALTGNHRERAAFARRQLERLREPVTRRMLVEALWGVTWPHDRLVVAASRLIRELDRVAPGKKISVLANRGLAGIDGTIATGTGIALAAADSATRAGTGAGVTRVLIGDLALLHDVGSLLVGAGEPELRIQLVVGNDGGGTIFDRLEVASTADSALVDRVLYTPQSVDLAALAAAYGWGYRRAELRSELDEALSATAATRVLIEVPLAR